MTEAKKANIPERLLMTAAKKAKELGAKSLTQVAQDCGQSVQTLNNWYKDRIKSPTFTACVEYSVRKNDMKHRYMLNSGIIINDAVGYFGDEKKLLAALETSMVHKVVVNHDGDVVGSW